MEQLLYQILARQEKKRVKTKDMESALIELLGSEGYWRNYGGYVAFAAAVSSLVGRGVIRPLTARGLNGMQPALYQGYQLLSAEDHLPAETRQELATLYHPAINVSYYFTRNQAYREDREYLQGLHAFLQQHPEAKKLPPIPANERSFQIFRDEKWLLSRPGRIFLQRVGFSLEDLRCYPTSEPFFYFQRPRDGSGSVQALIVENKDTFFSLKKLFQQGIFSWGGIPFTLLVYGEGRKIENSFAFFWELEEYKDCPVQFYYFGDVDPEGISIWYALQQRASLEISPMVFFYDHLLRQYRDRAPRLKKEQRLTAGALTAFLAYFPVETGRGLESLLEQKRYLPQEGLHYEWLRGAAD